MCKEGTTSCNHSDSRRRGTAPSMPPWGHKRSLRRPVLPDDEAPTPGQAGDYSDLARLARAQLRDTATERLVGAAA